MILALAAKLYEGANERPPHRRLRPCHRLANSKQLYQSVFDERPNDKFNFRTFVLELAASDAGTANF